MSAKKTINMTMDAGLLPVLNSIRVKYSEEIGCSLTQSQTLRILIRRAGMADTTVAEEEVTDEQE